MGRRWRAPRCIRLLRPTRASPNGPSLCSSLAPLPDDASESDMAHRGVDWLSVARGRPVAAAVVGGAQMRAALEDLAGDVDVALTGVVARAFRSAARVLRDAAGLGR